MNAINSRPAPGATALRRQWLLLAEMANAGDGLAVKEMADRHSVSQKTIRRDLEQLRSVGFPMLEQSEGRHGKKYWTIAAHWRSPGHNFTFDEAMALIVARHLLGPLIGTTLWQALDRAIKKIETELPESAVAYLQKMAPRFHDLQFGYSSYADKADILDPLMVGIEESRVVFITHQSIDATEPVTYDVYPYELCWHEGSLYLVGDSPSQHGEFRTWKLDRIVAAQAEQLRFQRRDDFDAQAFLNASFGMWQGAVSRRVVVRFTGTAARIANESRWHATQKNTPRKDGSTIVEFEAAVTPALVHWLLRFGREAKVIEPAELRKEVIRTINTVCELYGEPVPRSISQHGSSNKGKASVRRRRTL